MSRISWKTELERELDGETLISCTLTEAELERKFDGGFGGTNGAPFTAWSATRVFFPIGYDGCEWVGSAPRNPCDQALQHQGGG